MKSKIVAAAILGILSGLWVHYDYVKWGQRGRELFMAHQAMRFEMYMASPRLLIFTIVSFLMVVGFFLGVYELLVSLVSKMLEPRPQATVVST